MQPGSELPRRRFASVDPETLPLSSASRLFARLRGQVPRLLLRTPDGRADSWVEATIAGRRWRCAQPLTFTPYASVRPCSARCRFCSETLRPLEGGTAAASLRPGADYFTALQAALAELRGVPLSYSLSGLEMTDDPDWLLQLLQVLDQAAGSGVQVAERVLYSNGAGFAGTRGPALVAALQRFGLSWLELSRHHDDAAANAPIMRFRDGETIADGAIFEAVARQLAAALPLKLVCIVQRGGIDDAAGVARYIDWATRVCGARTVIFREFSRLGDGYRVTGSHRYIDAHRIGIDALLEDCMDASWWGGLEPLEVTEGYYFWNLRMRDAAGNTIVFESSDYTAMQARHDSGDLYKLVFFANGRLCSGWQPDRDLVWEMPHG